MLSTDYPVSNNRATVDTHLQRLQHLQTLISSSDTYRAAPARTPTSHKQREGVEKKGGGKIWDKGAREACRGPLWSWRSTWIHS